MKNRKKCCKRNVLKKHTIGDGSYETLCRGGVKPSAAHYVFYMTLEFFGIGLIWGEKNCFKNWRLFQRNCFYGGLACATNVLYVLILATYLIANAYQPFSKRSKSQYVVINEYAHYFLLKFLSFSFYSEVPNKWWL